MFSSIHGLCSLNAYSTSLTPPPSYNSQPCPQASPYVTWGKIALVENHWAWHSGALHSTTDPVKEMVDDSPLWWLQWRNAELCLRLVQALLTHFRDGNLIIYWGFVFLEFISVWIQNLPPMAPIIRSVDVSKRPWLLPFICKETPESWPIGAGPWGGCQAPRVSMTTPVPAWPWRSCMTLEV